MPKATPPCSVSHLEPVKSKHPRTYNFVHQVGLWPEGHSEHCASRMTNAGFNILKRSREVSSGKIRVVRLTEKLPIDGGSGR